MDDLLTSYIRALIAGINDKCNASTGKQNSTNKAIIEVS